MWNFSWLQAHHPGGSFYDLERCVIEAARIFAGFPWAGLTLSNHAEPLFSLWQDADWHD